ncbi:diguanylate cyclase domain-containing protein [Aeromonas salmonicida]
MPLLLIILACLPARVAAQDPIVLQLKWHHQFQFAGYYAAIAQGYYRDAGLDVRLREAGPGTDVVDEVVSGRAHYGVGSSDLLLDRQRGQPVVVLATPFQHSPLVLLARAEIDNVHDLVGRRLMLEYHSEELIAYLQHEGVALGLLHRQPHTLSADALIRGEVDAMSAYNTDETYTLQQSGVPYQTFTPRSAGIDFYGDNLFTSESELRDHGARVRAFREASLKGWRYAMLHPEEVVAWILTQYPATNNPALDRNKLLFEAKQMQPLIRADLVEMGYMYPGRWQHIAQTYMDLGLLTAMPDLDSFLYSQQEERAHQQQLMIYQGIAIGLLVTAFLLILLMIFLRLNRRLREESKARHQLSQEIADNERHFRFITENSADVIWTMDIQSGRFTYLSPSVQHLRGFTVEEVLAQTGEELMTAESADRIARQMKESLATWAAGDHINTKRVTLVDQPHKDGRLIHTEVVTTLHADKDGNPVSVLGVTRDISDRKASEEMMRQLAFYDPLTHLPNRRLLQDRLQHSLQQADGKPLALLFIDLDHFKPVNDQHGHEAGDWLLATVAKRMLHCVREGDTVARIGGDEFMVLLPEITGEAGAIAIAEAIHQSLNQTFAMTDALHFHISSCIGVALYPQHGTTQKQLMNHGDQAMYQAKEAGRNRIQLFTPQMAGGITREAANQMQLGWKQSHDCGHPQIDDDHRQLFALANQLLNGVLTMEEDTDQFHQNFEALLALAASHFNNEEAILAKLEYAELDTHRQEHQKLLHRADSLYQAARTGELTSLTLLEFVLQDLVLGHMVKQDRRYFPLLQASMQEEALLSPDGPLTSPPPGLVKH